MQLQGILLIYFTVNHSN